MEKKVGLEMEAILHLLQQVFDASPALMYVKNRAGRFVLVNRPMALFYGLTVEDMLGKADSELRLPNGDAVGAFHPDDLTVLDTLQEVHLPEAQYTNHQGEAVWFQLTKRPLPGKDGRTNLFLCVAVDITGRKVNEDRLVQLAMFDTLTNLPNRYLMEDRLRQILAQAQREKYMVGIIILNLYHFHEINDTLGRTVGDELLRQTAGRLEKTIRQSDTLAFLGGNDFVMLLINIHSDADVQVVTRKLFEVLKQPFRVRMNELYLDACIGYCLYPEDGRDVNTLLRNAENSLAFANLTGGNSLRRYEPFMNNEALEKLEMTNRLRQAIEQGELMLYYQPQVDITSGKVAGLEALVRWNNPDMGGIVPPGEFIPLAEESGLINSIGYWVLGEACRQMIAWREQGHPELQVAVNTSPIQYAQSDFIERAVEIIQSYEGIAPRLVIEVTESVFMQQIDKTAGQLDRLRGMGIHVHVDDFGTAYSSLAYLRKLPVDCLKIDQTFIREMSTAEGEEIDPATLVRAIITLGHSFRMSVLAEGVETWREYSILSALGCDLAQGYLFSRPLPADEVWETIAKINDRVGSRGSGTL